jgi:hypothetical protein
VSDHLEQLRKARAALVRARRDQAKALANPNAKVFSPDAKAFTQFKRACHSKSGRTPASRLPLALQTPWISDRRACGSTPVADMLLAQARWSQ